MRVLIIVFLLFPGAVFVVQGHEVKSVMSPEAVAMPFRSEGEPAGGVAEVVTGEGGWVFVAEQEGVLPIPEEARPFVRGAHGTLVVDVERDVVYWGLEKVGWVAFGDGLTRSWVVAGDPALKQGNLHGADLLPRRGQLPLVAAADNVEGEVYVSDTRFSGVSVLGWPEGAPYQKREEYHPTDVAFVGGDELYVTDGYGAAYFGALQVDPLGYRGAFWGGKSASRTPHGVTYDATDGSLLLSARPEGQVKRWRPGADIFEEVMGLPVGSTVCDVELRGDYALAPCLNGPEKSPGPIYVVNLKQRTLVSTLRPKLDLGFADAQHIHDAAWYEREGQLYVIFTSWNPGGIGLLKRVRP